MIDASTLPVGHWVVIHTGGLEDVAPHDEPVVKHQRRINARRMQSPPQDPDPRDTTAVWEWLQARQTGQLALWGTP